MSAPNNSQEVRDSSPTDDTSRLPQPTPSSLEDILVTLVLEIGQQVTKWYETKHGLWEGMSTQNVKSLDKALENLQQHILTEILDMLKDETGFEIYGSLCTYEQHHDIDVRNDHNAEIRAKAKERYT